MHTFTLDGKCFAINGFGTITLLPLLLPLSLPKTTTLRKWNQISSVSWALEALPVEVSDYKHVRWGNRTVVYHHRMDTFTLIQNAKTYRKIKLCYANCVCALLFAPRANIW